MKNPTVLAINNGFYLFGDLLDNAPDGYVAMTSVAMFGGFSGGKGMPGVTRGERGATITLDRFDANKTCMWPINSVCGVYPSVDLYKFKGTTLR